MRVFPTAAAIVVAAASVAPAWVLAAPGDAQGQASAPARAPDYSWQDKLDRRTGEVFLEGPKVKLTLGKDYYFLGDVDARRVLVEGWGNPPESVGNVLGMIVPTRFKPLQDGVWAAVVTFEESGYVSDEDAGDIDAAKLLTELREGEADSNAARTKAGYPTINLVGWAEPPSYHPDRHYAVWAQDLQFGQEAGRTLNYDIRVLGRRGVLSLNVVADITDLAEVKAAASGIVQTAAYEPGERYGDYKKGLDKKAEYGVAGLVAAGLGAAAVKKLGLLGLILAFGKKAFVFIIAGGAALFGWVRNMLAGGKRKTVNPAASEPPTSGSGDIVS
jgi:uncharacterized membrane-anchored protein